MTPTVRTFEPGELRAAVARALVDGDATTVPIEHWAPDEVDAVLAALGIDGDQPVTVVRGRLKHAGDNTADESHWECLYRIVPAPSETGGSNG